MLLLIKATERVCYGKYGCFSHAKPFHSPFLELPQDPSLVNTTFLLFTRSNRDVIQYIDDSDKGKLQKSNFDISKRTIIIVHGWRGKIPFFNCSFVCFSLVEGCHFGVPFFFSYFVYGISVAQNTLL